MAKRGRKPKEKSTGYFYEEQEKAVIDYLNAETAEEKNRIYCDVLKPAFKIMIESIIRRYKLYIPNEEFENTFNDTLSFLLTKADKYDKDKNKKAYSYYGTICKNYLYGRIESYSKSLQRNPSYDSVVEEFNNSMKYSDEAAKSSSVATETIERLVSRITQMVENPKENDLKENEIKLGRALITLFENWEYVLTTDGSNKLNKNAILLFLRENTGLDTKGIRDNMKKYKKEFLIIKDMVIN